MTLDHAEMPYAELHCRSSFSFLDGTSDPEALVARAAEVGLSALALTDTSGLSGMVRFLAAIEEHRAAGDPRGIVGADLALDDGERLVLLARDADGYRTLCRLLSEAHAHGAGEAGAGGRATEPRLPAARLDGLTAGLLALARPHRAVVHPRLGGTTTDPLVARLGHWADLFGADNVLVETRRHLVPGEGATNAALRRAAGAVGLRCVATNDVRYAARERALLHDVVTAIRLRVPLARAAAPDGMIPPLLPPNRERRLKGAAEMARLFRDHPEEVAATVEVAARCAFDPRDLRYEFPRPDTIPEGRDAYDFLVAEVWQGALRYYGRITPTLQDRMVHELGIVKLLDLAGYLLVFKDIVDFCRRERILVSVRGSAPASVLLYCLGLCPIDPLEHGLLFERFASPERGEYPDIDLDIAHEDRERVIQYVYGRYGRERAAMVAEVNTYRARSAVRDVAFALGLPQHQIDALAKTIDLHDDASLDLLVGAGEDASAPGPRGRCWIERPTPDTLVLDPDPARIDGDESDAAPDEDGRDDARHDEGGAPMAAQPALFDPPQAEAQPAPLPIDPHEARLLVDLARQLLGAPRHLAIHVGGMVISARPLADVAPIQPARMPGRTILPWDKDDLAILGERFGVNLIKIDLLGLGMLAVISRCFASIEAGGEEHPSLHGFRYDDRVYDVLCAGDTVGLFQVESRAQIGFLPRLVPRSLHDVAISVGAIRPGPGATGAGGKIARRRAGQEPTTYPHPDLEPALAGTAGVLLWQEQAMQVATIMGGYTLGEGERLRRAMTHKRSYEHMAALCDDLVEKMLARGHPPALAEEIRRMIVGFAGYGFPRAHAYAFAHLALVSATLKLRHPAAYYAALLNCQPMGFYAPHTLIWDAHRHGVGVRAVDVNASGWECAVEGGAIRLGYALVAGLGPRARERLEHARADGPYRSLADFVRRTGLDRDAVERLAEVGAFVRFDERRAAVWRAGELAGLGGPGRLPGLADAVAEPAALPAMDAWDTTRADYAGLGLSPDRHLVAFYRARLRADDVLAATQLAGVRAGIVRVGGLVICRQRPETARGFLFMTLEDETGLVNVVVRPDVYRAHRQAVRGEPLIVVEGVLAREDGATNVLARRAWPLPHDPSARAVPSHDYR